MYLPQPGLNERQSVSLESPHRGEPPEDDTSRADRKPRGGFKLYRYLNPLTPLRLKTWTF